MIERFETKDGRVGYDKFNQLVLATREDDTVCYRFIRDVREWTCALCLHGWEPNGASMGDQEHWYLINAIVHQTCLTRHHGFIERQQIRSALVESKLRLGEALPNEPG